MRRAQIILKKKFFLRMISHHLVKNAGARKTYSWQEGGGQRQNGVEGEKMRFFCRRATGCKSATIIYKRTARGVTGSLTFLGNLLRLCLAHIHQSFVDLGRRSKGLGNACFNVRPSDPIHSPETLAKQVASKLTCWDSIPGFRLLKGLRSNSQTHQDMPELH